MMSRGVALSGNASDNSIWNYDRAQIKRRVGGAVVSIGLALIPRQAQHFEGSLASLPLLFLSFCLSQLVVCAIPYKKRDCRLCSTLAKDAISIYYGTRQLHAIIYGMCIASLATSYSSFYTWLHNAHIILNSLHIKHVSSLSISFSCPPSFSIAILEILLALFSVDRMLFKIFGNRSKQSGEDEGQSERERDRKSERESESELQSGVEKSIQLH